jgi:hypothetical protein
MSSLRVSARALQRKTPRPEERWLSADLGADGER